MVTSCVIYKCSDRHKKDCKVRCFRLPGVRKDADNKTFERKKASLADENQQAK